MLDVRVIQFERDEAKQRYVLTLDNNTQVIMTFEVVSQLSEDVPKTSEEQFITKLINEIHKIRENRIKDFETLDKEYEKLSKKLEDAEDALVGVGLTKTDIMAVTARIKSLTARKAILQERRHLLKLTHIEEGDLRAQLANLKHGSRQRKD